MKFMILVKADKDSEAGKLPDEQLIVKMGKFNEELVKAGVLLAADGLAPSSKGARIKFGAGKPTVIDGPFTETKELLAGYWVVQMKSRAECIEWFSRCPSEVGEIEIRQIHDAEDFAPVITSDAGRAALAAEQAFRAKAGVS
jgi:hypothetical protein